MSNKEKLNNKKIIPDTDNFVLRFRSLKVCNIESGKIGGIKR